MEVVELFGLDEPAHERAPQEVLPRAHAHCVHLDFAVCGGSVSGCGRGGGEGTYAILSTTDWEGRLPSCSRAYELTGELRMECSKSVNRTWASG